MWHPCLNNAWLIGMVISKVIFMRDLPDYINLDRFMLLIIPSLIKK